MTLQPSPCPFCSSENAAPYAVKSCHSVLCVACGGEGPEADSEVEAIEAWNRRAALASQAQPEQDSVHLTSDAVVRAATAPAPDNAALTNAYAEGRKDEHGDCIELIAWAYKKLHHANYQRMEDALMLDRMKLLLEHGIHA